MVERSNPGRDGPNSPRNSFDSTGSSERDDPQHKNKGGGTKKNPRYLPDPNRKLGNSLIQKRDPSFLERFFTNGWKHRVLSNSGSGYGLTNLTSTILIAQAISSICLLFMSHFNVSFSVELTLVSA